MKAADWLTLPERIDCVTTVRLTAAQRKAYDKFERDMYIEFTDGEVSAVSAAALTNKLLQYSNGAMYTESGGYIEVSESKLDALGEIIEAANGAPILCFYSYRHDLERIQRRFPQAVKLESAEHIADWNEGRIQLLLAHPAGAGHGLNLQAGGNIIVWFGLTWSLELYQQANARLHRQGQQRAVIVHHLLTENTADERVYRSLRDKSAVQDELLEALKEKYGGRVK
jgi:SNF2 family DNA or RNA helicase